MESFDLKIGRAKEHLDTLEGETRAFRDRNPFLVAERRFAKRTEYRVEIRERTPPRLAIIVGDILQNARSALDHIAWRLAGSEATRDTSFPIYANRDDYFGKERTGKPAPGSGLFRVASFPQEAQDIIESIQPYQGTQVGMTLAALNDLAKIDRHRTLHIVGGVSSATKFTTGRRDANGVLTPAWGDQGELNIRYGPFDDGVVIGSFTHGEDVEVDCQFVFDIALSDTVPAKRVTSLLPAMRAIVSVVTNEVLPGLRPYLRTAQAPSWGSQPVDRTVDLGYINLSEGRKIAIPPEKDPRRLARPQLSRRRTAGHVQLLIALSSSAPDRRRPVTSYWIPRRAARWAILTTVNCEETSAAQPPGAH